MIISMDEREFFDKLAPVWDNTESNSTPDKINFILDLIGIEKGQRILDLGTGTGVLLPYLAERTGETGSIMAVDYSEGMLQRAKEKFSGLIPKPLFLNSDFENETLPGEYDHIILYCVYPHLHNPVETLKWLRKVNLAKEGDIVIAFPTDENFINSIHKDRHSESDLLLSAPQLAGFLNKEGLTAVVLAADKESYVIKIR